MSLLTCTISGTATDSSGAGVSGLWMRFSVGAPPSGGIDAPPYVLSNYRRSNDGTVFDAFVVSASPQVIYTDTDGAFSIELPQGATFRVEAPWADIDHVGTVPGTSTAAFSDVFLNCQRWVR